MERGPGGRLLVTPSQLPLLASTETPGWPGGGSVARDLLAVEGGLPIALQPGVAPLGEEGEVLPFITGTAGAGGFIGEHLLLVVPLAQVDHGGGALGLVVEVGGEGDIVVALVVHRAWHPQLAAFYLQLGDPLLVALLHALAQIARLPALIAPLDPAALDSALGFLLLGRKRGNRLGIEGRQLVIQRGQPGILADEGFGGAFRLGAIEGRGGRRGQQGGKQQGAKQDLVHRQAPTVG